MVGDPALEIPLQSRRDWWRARLKLAIPLLAWVVVAIATLVTLGLDRAPLWALPFLLALVVSGIALIVVATPLTLRSMREVSGALAARRANQVALPALQQGDPAAAEAALLAVTPRVMAPSARSVVLHNLGVAALQQGDLARAAARMARAREGGWLDAWALRRHRGGFAQGRAMLAIVTGDLDAARAALATVSAGPVSAALAPYRAMAELLLALRADHPDAAARAAAVTPADLPPAARPLAAAACAWALTRGGAHPQAIQAALDAAPRLEPGRPAWAAQHWPELAAFVAALPPDDDA